MKRASCCGAIQALCISAHSGISATLLKEYLGGGGRTRGRLRLIDIHASGHLCPMDILEYDTLEYRQQIDDIRKMNKEEGRLSSPAERLCGVRKTDRLAPVYTICLYHGEEKWDGPRTLRDMMDFGESEDKFLPYFSDYPMHLYCINESDDFSVFHTELKKLFKVLQNRKDRKSLKELVWQNEEYRNLDADTAETMMVMLNFPESWIRKHLNKFKNEKGKYDMCQAIREWPAEEREAGRQEGIFEAFCLLIKDGLLQIEEAAKRSRMSVEEFRMRMEQSDLQ